MARLERSEELRDTLLELCVELSGNGGFVRDFLEDFAVVSPHERQELGLELADAIDLDLRQVSVHHTKLINTKQEANLVQVAADTSVDDGHHLVHRHW